MSDIHGDGFGSSHDWLRDITDEFGGEMGTRYFCRNRCGACLVHRYNSTPDIFQAIEEYGIADVCPGEADR